ncbi:autotransporter outer membrane beta-barrel domain-containing protein, partial [Saezia sanguinis]
DNQLSGAAQSHTSKYDSSGYALSAEIGYGIEINRHEDGSAWILEPHAQVIYSHLEADNFYDSHGTWYSNNQASGYQTRLGARLYGQLATDQKGVAPFIELNWLHNNVDNGVQLNGMALSSDIGRNVGEVKIGVQGELTERL